MNSFDVETFNVAQFDEILSRGLCKGQGDRDGQMCIEAAICTVLGLPHSDDPKCVSKAVRSFKIALNDKRWSSPKARAKGLRDLGLAQLGSKGVVDDEEFTARLTEKIIRVLLPTFVREFYHNNPDLLTAADFCEKDGTVEAARDLHRISTYVAYPVYAAAFYSLHRTLCLDAYTGDKYLNLVASLALEVLRELKSPGVSLLASIVG